MTVPSLKNNRIPALSENTPLRYFHFIALYFAQGVPEGMLLFGIPAWMATHGKTPGEIAGFAVAVGLPWSLKFVVAPLMDRYTYLAMGRRRPWVMAGQAGLVLSFIGLAYVPDPLGNLSLFMAAGFAVGFFGAVQDVATDGMAVDLIPASQQARASGLMWGAKIVGTAASLALGSWVLERYGFTLAILVLSSFTGLTLLAPLCLKERQGEKLVPWAAGMASPENTALQLGGWGVLFRSLYQVCSLRNSLLLAAILFVLQGSYNYISTLLPIFTVKGLGWTHVSYSQGYGAAKLTGGIGGMLLGGFLIDRFGKGRMMNVYCLLMILSTAALAWFSSCWIHAEFIYTFMLVYSTLSTFATIGIFSMAMQCCWKKVSASQFTLLMTVSNLGRVALAALIGPVKASFDWPLTLLFFAVMIGAAWLLLRFLDIPEQLRQVARLDGKEKKTGSPERVLSAH